ncbi:ChaN family lipoprotein [Desulfoluna butyratoxydans]|uniref:Haem-binding uptake tiki superfamily chan n=1 Tax=Desulfoluna butyratoxydans TaxID=231438 RepID=A0A4U8YTR9_9BACT|nr:ChaN family lipoprotein [Desulfoluna butyratoxydans]VFQ46957.1 haem-binding uptake tiki superfamily chan [Desulfoluna butyratoxydans]
MNRALSTLGLFLGTLLFAAGCLGTGRAAMEPPRYTIIAPDGTRISRDALLTASARADVVLVGETHDNPSAHHLEYALFKELLEKRSAEEPSTGVVLSFEMLARDLQGVTDEYLSGLITEMHFMAASRPWGNYTHAYRRTLNLAKERGAPVIAANAPRRYVNLVARKGREALGQLSPEAKAWIAPLPYEGASPAYRAKLEALERHILHASQKDNPHGTKAPGSPPSTINTDAQALWDATMAWSIAEARHQYPGALVMHISGIFHCEGGLGIPEHLALYDPSASMIIITIRPPSHDDALPAFSSDRSIPEYLVITD